MKPNEIMADYETGLRAAIRKFWPGVKLRGCWFHFCKNINKRCRKLNMSRLLKKNSRAKRIKKALMSLPLLPAEQIIEGYECVKRLARSKRLFKSFSKLFSYFESYWLKQVYFNSFNFIGSGRTDKECIMDLRPSVQDIMSATFFVLAFTF